MVKKNIVATLANYDGLPSAVVDKIKEKRYYPDQVFDVKQINGNKVVIRSSRYDEQDEFEVGMDNVRLFKKLGDDYMVYNPQKQAEPASNEKGE